MDHLNHLCQDHTYLVVVMAAALFMVGIFAAGGKQFFVDFVNKLRGSTTVEVVVGNSKAKSDLFAPPLPGPLPNKCPYPVCPQHEAFKAMVDKMEQQQQQNINSIASLITQHQVGITRLAEVEKQQAKQWEKLELLPEIKGELSSVKKLVEQVLAARR